MRVSGLRRGTAAEGLHIRGAAHFARKGRSRDNVLPTHQAGQLAFDAGRQDVGSGFLVTRVCGYRIQTYKNDRDEGVHEDVRVRPLTRALRFFVLCVHREPNSKGWLPTTKLLSDFGAGVSVDLQANRDLDYDRFLPLHADLPPASDFRRTLLSHSRAVNQRSSLAEGDCPNPVDAHARRWPGKGAQPAQLSKLQGGGERYDVGVVRITAGEYVSGL